MTRNIPVRIDITGGDRWSAAERALVDRAAAAAVSAADACEDDDDPPLSYEVSVLLADDETVRALNRDWRGQDKPTNVLSFPADMPEMPGAPRLKGDIALARETLVREAEDQDKTLEQHLQHLVVHGVLHLFGYDHVDDADAEEMEAFETEILAALGVPDPYAAEDAASEPA